MLKKLLNKLKGLFTRKPPAKRQYAKKGDVVGNVTLLTDAQLVKHTEYLPGESYRLGEAIVTVHSNKESMLAAIRATDLRREAREAKMRERAIDLMLLTPEQLEQYKIGEWLTERNKRDTWLSIKMGKLMGKDRYIKPVEAPPSGKATERFEQLMKASETKDEVKIS